MRGVSQVVDRLLEISQSVNKEKKRKKNSEPQRSVGSENPNICIKRIPKGEEK